MYVAKIWVRDDRPEKEKGKDKPKDGWRSKGGKRKLPRDVNGSDPAEVCTALANVLSSKDPEKRAAVVQIQIQRQDAVSAESLDW